MKRPYAGWLLIAAGMTLGCEVAALAQGPGGVQNGAPFSATYRRPAVSPYTMMSMGGIGSMNGMGGMGGMGGVGGGFNPLVYQQLVQPREQQEQQAVTQLQQGRQINTLQNRVQQIQRDTTSRQVSGQIRPTGHGATYLNLSHYYMGR